ncbi:hypothetical protein N7537_010401 [Penicillium hordei]|uniref:Uncharacterized protein n=1 Tax=Penicillium hordei TaxID=40994 RepID=A0AAD6DUR5_9EURO|nr:uncharacterized protein N7537_010401 [Penicillium hordei]KAJ5593497.1 hypothetical protein N7537_010401 [Penicillium hordei]
MQAESLSQRRPTKRRRRSSSLQDFERPENSISGPGLPIFAPPQMTQMTQGVNSALTNEIKLLIGKCPALVPQAIWLVDVYQCLWEAYLKAYAKVKVAGEEQRLLRNSNNWLEETNESLRRICTDREASLCDSLQAFQSVRQGILNIFQDTYRLHQLLPSSRNPATS